MAKIDTSRPFVPIGIAVLTVSDTRTTEDDKSGDILAQRIDASGHAVQARAIVKDDIPAIQAQVKSWINDPEIDAIISTGGTGLTGRDVTPEAFAGLYDKVIDGFSVLFHKISYDKIGMSTIQSRASAGVAGGTYLFALPGSPGACKDGWDEILKYQLDYRFMPCNFIEIMPRLDEHLKRQKG